MPSDARSKFPNSLEIAFDVQEAHQQAVANNFKVKTVIRDSIRQHVIMCLENADNINDALALTEELNKEIDWRVSNTPNAWAM